MGRERDISSRFCLCFARAAASRRFLQNISVITPLLELSRILEQREAAKNPVLRNRSGPSRFPRRSRRENPAGPPRPIIWARNRKAGRGNFRINAGLGRRRPSARGDEARPATRRSVRTAARSRRHRMDRLCRKIPDCVSGGSFSHLLRMRGR